MKFKLLLAIFAFSLLGPFQVHSQQKIGTFDFSYLCDYWPEFDQMEKELYNLHQQFEKEIRSMSTILMQEMEDFNSNSGNWSEEKKTQMNLKLATSNAEFEAKEKSFSLSMESENRLMTERLFQKVLPHIRAVAKEEGFTHIFDGMNGYQRTDVKPGPPGSHVPHPEQGKGLLYYLEKEYDISDKVMRRMGLK